MAAQEKKTVAKSAGSSRGFAWRKWREEQKTRPQPGLLLSMRVIVTSTSIALVAALTLAGGYIYENNVRQTITHEIQTRLMLEARTLALLSQDALLTEFPELTLHPMVKAMVRNREELSFAAVVDHGGFVQAHSDARQLGGLFESPEDLEPWLSDVSLRTGETLQSSDQLFVAITPVLHPSGRVIGKSVVALKRDHVLATIAAAREQQGFIASVILIVGILLALGLMSWLLRPLSALQQGIARIGEGDLETPLQIRGSSEIRLLANTVNEMASSLKEAQDGRIEKERLAHEIRLARSIQQSILPKRELQTADYRVAGRHRAATEVGGDYYDYFQLADGKIGLAIADVAGKGLAGCLVMAMLSALLRAFKDRYESPSQLLVALEDHLAPSLQPGTFVTMFYAVLDTTGGELTYASAGHCPTILYRAETGSTEELYTRGIPIGAVRGGALESTLDDRVVRLEPGDSLIQYTDGFTEAFAANGTEQFGIERVAEGVKTAMPQGADAFLDMLPERIRDWSGGSTPHDDETTVVLSRAVEDTMAAKSGAPFPSTQILEMDILGKLARAQRGGNHLRISASFEDLRQIDAWVTGCPQFRSMEHQHVELLSIALYEICANIAEHGYHLDASKALDIWWVSGAERGAPREPDGETVEAGCGPIEIIGGYFLVRDRGDSYRTINWTATDFSDPETRKQGRGFGLQIIHSVMKLIRYSPETPAGNLTLLRINPAVWTERNKEEPQ